MASGPKPSAEQPVQDVSPELIAAITERVKREVMEHLRQTANTDDQQRVPSLQSVPSRKVEDLKPSASVEDEPEAPPLERAPSNISQSSTSSPPPTVRRVHTPPSPTQAPISAGAAAPQPGPVGSPSGSPSEKLSGVRFSDRPLPRPGQSRTYSTVELSTIDQKWGRLFDNEGNPTQRLGQFLRGLANRIIEESPAKRSIVAPPSKMAAYYATHALDNETHPLVSIFRSQSNEQISRLYQDLGCEHHLIQEHTTSTPTIPALTPVGFAHWMTIHILAYPEEEAKRLEKVVLAMPIDADGVILDGRPERLPKQISRYLFPPKEDRKSRKWVENAISHFLNNLGTSSRRKESITSRSSSQHSSTSQFRSRPVEIHQTGTSPTTPKGQPIERERNPYAGAPTTWETSSNEEPIKIERDRQPYTAQPGSGKIYIEGNSYNAPPGLGRANSTSQARDKPNPAKGRSHRSQSTASQNYVPPPYPGIRNPNSPSINSYSNSTPDDLNGYQYPPPSTSASSSFSNQSQQFSPSSYGSNTSIPPPPPPVDTDKRVREHRQYRRGTDEDARSAVEFKSPRDAERWDRIQESRSGEFDRKDRPYESKPSMPFDPRDPRGAAYEDWYRDKGRAAGYNGYMR